MLVKDLIRDSLWLPGADYGKKTAELCITLPTYRRLACGLFERCVDTLLAQEFTDFELIIVDDASTDGTFERIKEYMKADGRVSCIRHPRNVGLPAVSSYESYLRSTAAYFGHAFDDCTFEPDAFSRLLAEAKRLNSPAVVGYGTTVNPLGQMVHVGKNAGPRELSNLRLYNFLLHHCLLLHRDIFETVGHYDPHVSLIRLCDWDLLRRIHARGLLTGVDVYVGYEGGGVAEGTLARSFEMDMLTVLARMDTERTAALSTRTLPDYDVLALPRGLSREALDAFAGHVRRDYGQRFWYSPVVQEGYAFDDTGRGLHITPPDAAPLIYAPFDGLPRDTPPLFHTHPAECVVRPEVAIASAYVIMSQAASSQQMLRLAQLLHHSGTPVYYHDPEGVLLRLMRKADTPAETREGIRQTLGLFTGICASTQDQADRYKEAELHASILILPPVYRSDLALPRTREQDVGVLSLALPDLSGAGIDVFLQRVYPAVRALAQSVRLRLLCPGNLAERLGRFLNNTEITAFAEPADHARLVTTLASFAPDIVLHTEPEDEDGVPRPPLALLAASAAGGILLTARGALRGVPESALALAEDTPEGWREALFTLLHAPDERANAARAADAWCRAHFGAERAACALRELSLMHPAPNAFEMRMRMRRLLLAEAR